MATDTTNAAKLQNVPKKKGYNNIGDPVIWGIYISLVLISLLESFSSSGQMIKSAHMYAPIFKHAILLAAGFGILLIIHLTNYKRFPLFIMIFALVTLVMLILAPFIGEEKNDATRSINLGIFSIQPAEMAKVAIVGLIAWITAKFQVKNDVQNKGVIICAILVLFYSAFTFLQGLTNTALLMGISFIMFTISGTKIKKIFAIICVYVIAAVLFYSIKSYNDERIENLKMSDPAYVAKKEVKKEEFANDNEFVKFVSSFGRGGTWIARIMRHYTPPALVEQEITQENKQEMFARMAQAHSNVIGVGPGNSRECSRLPLAFSDYIYSIIVEELGVFGGLFVLILFLALMFRAKKIADDCSYALPAFLVLGMATLISLQAFFHMAINTGVIPVSGQPLPLISMGGTSCLMISMAFGVILSVSRYSIKNAQDKELKKIEREQLPEDLRAENPLIDNN